MLGKDTYVLISTSVLDNGVNFKDINNIIVSDMLKAKCLQMAGRVKAGGVDDRKTLYVKRFGVDEVEKRITDLMKHQDAYHSYELAYEQEEPSASKNYNGKSCDWEDHCKYSCFVLPQTHKQACGRRKGDCDMNLMKEKAVEIIRRMPEDNMAYVINILQNLEAMSIDRNEDKKRAQNALAEILSMEKRLLNDFDPEKELETEYLSG